MQYRTKIIALFTSVCLLVGMMVVPSAAIQDFYNLNYFPGYYYSEFGAEVVYSYFDRGSVPLVYTQKVTSEDINDTIAQASCSVHLTSVNIPATNNFSLRFVFPDAVATGFNYQEENVRFEFDLMSGSGFNQNFVVVCYNFDGTNDLELKSNDFLSGAVLEPIYSGSSIVGFTLSGNLTEAIDRIFFSGFFPLPSPTAVTGYTHLYFSSHDDLIITTDIDDDSGSVGGDSGSSGDSGNVGSSCDCPDYTSLLTSILSLLNASSSDADTIIGSIGDLWIRLYYIEENTLSILNAISALAPSEQETALKEATSDVTSAYTEKFWGSDSDSALGSASITESADILSGTKSLFSTGVSTSDLFGLFGRESWGRWFSEETRADLHTVPDVAVIGLDEDDAKSEYEKNLDSIRDFMGR